MHACVNPACFRWGTTVSEFVQVSHAAGFASVEVSIQQAASLAADLGGLDALSTWIHRAGVKVEQFSGIIPAGPVLPAPLLVDQEAFTASLPGLTHRLDVAAALGCTRAAIVLNPRTDLVPAQARDLALTRLDLLATRAARAQIALNVEFIAVTAVGADLDGPHAFLNGPAGLLELLDELGRPDVNVLLDLCHLYAAGTTLAREPGLHGRIGFVQVCDIPPGTRPEQMNDARRALPGTGISDYQALSDDLHTAGYDGPLSIEVFSEQLWALDPPTAAERLHASTSALLPTPTGGSK